MTTTVRLCADKANLAAAKAAIHRSERNVSGLLVTLTFGGLTIQTFGDASPADLADTLERLASEVRGLAMTELQKMWESYHAHTPACDGGDLPYRPSSTCTHCEKPITRSDFGDWRHEDTGRVTCNGRMTAATPSTSVAA